MTCHGVQKCSEMSNYNLSADNSEDSGENFTIRLYVKTVVLVYTNNVGDYIFSIEPGCSFTQHLTLASHNISTRNQSGE